MAVDAASDQLRGVWTNEYYPVGLFADSVQGKLYCLSEWPALVSVIDPFANKVLGSIPLPGCPQAMAFNNVDRKAYVAVGWSEETEDAVVVIDAVGDTVLTEIAVARTPNFMVYDADDDLLYVADSSSDRVLAIDGRTDRVVDSCRVYDYPIGLLYNGARRRLYSVGKRGEVAAITPRVHGQNNYITVDGGLECFALDARGATLFGGNTSLESLFVIDCVGESLAGMIGVPLPPVALCYDSQHDQLYSVYGEEHSGMSAIDCPGRFVRAIVEVDAQRLYWDPGADAVYCITDSSVTVVDGRTRRVAATLDVVWPAGVASAPGWPRVYVAQYDDSYLRIVRTDEWPQVPAAPDAQATVVGGKIDWTGTQAVMYDKCGRRVADVHRGENDVSRLQPGVYFVRQNGVPRGTYARKVVITR